MTYRRKHCHFWVGPVLSITVYTQFAQIYPAYGSFAQQIPITSVHLDPAEITSPPKPSATTCVFMMLYGHLLGRVHSYSEGSGWGMSAMHRNFFWSFSRDCTFWCKCNLRQKKFQSAEVGRAALARPIQIRRCLQQVVRMATQYAPAPVSWQHLRIYSPGGTCSGMMAI